MSTDGRIRVAGVGAAFAAAFFGFAHAPVAGADPAIDPFEDLYGVAPWTINADNALDANPFLAVEAESVVDSVRVLDGDPFTDLVKAMDPNAFPGDVPNPNDLLGVLAGTLDYGLDTISVQVSMDGGITTVIEPLGVLVESFLGI
jgi:hypothetical protein